MLQSLAVKLGQLAAEIAGAVTYSAIRAYFDAVRDATLAHEEQPTDVDRARADRFRDAVSKLRQSNANASHTGPVDTAPSSEAFYGNDLHPHSQRHDSADGTGARRVVDRQPDSGRAVI